MYTDEVIKKAIPKQKAMIRKSGFEPTWELFEKTFGWFQIKQKITLEQQELYKSLWNKA